MSIFHYIFRLCSVNVQTMFSQCLVFHMNLNFRAYTDCDSLPPIASPDCLPVNDFSSRKDGKNPYKRDMSEGGYDRTSNIRISSHNHPLPRSTAEDAFTYDGSQVRREAEVCVFVCVCVCVVACVVAHDTISVLPYTHNVSLFSPSSSLLPSPSFPLSQVEPYHTADGANNKVHI